MTAAAKAPEVTGFWDAAAGSVQYVLADPATRRCVIVGPVLDFDPLTGRVTTRSAHLLLDHVSRRGLVLDWIPDTHPHADHLSAAGYLKDRRGPASASG